MDVSAELLQHAQKVRQRAYAPYSQFQVGAALLADSGKIYTGCNVENASYGLTSCAERVAVGKAISEGEASFQAIALSVKGAGSPCGACRQILSEFSPNLTIYLGDENGQLIEELTLRELLPRAFGSQSL